MSREYEWFSVTGGMGLLFRADQLSPWWARARRQAGQAPLMPLAAFCFLVSPQTMSRLTSSGVRPMLLCGMPRRPRLTLPRCWSSTLPWRLWLAESCGPWRHGSGRRMRRTKPASGASFPTNRASVCPALPSPLLPPPVNPPLPPCASVYIKALFISLALQS